MSMRHKLAIVAVMTLAAPLGLGAQVATPYVSSYLPGPYNWEFRRAYPSAERLFNGVEYSQARLFETLWTSSRMSASRL